MDYNKSWWILCPSKNFPGKMYYFNTKTGEKGWSQSDSMNIPMEARVISPPTSTRNIDMSKDTYSQKPSNSDSSRQQEQLLMGSSELSSSNNDSYINNTSPPGYNQIPNNCSSTQGEQLPMESRELSALMTNNYDNMQRRYSCKDNPVSWRQPEECTGSRDSMMGDSDIFMDVAQYTFKPSNNPTSINQPNQLQIEFRQPMANKKIVNTQVENTLTNNSFFWKLPQQSNHFKEFTFPINNRFNSNAHSFMSVMSNNTFSFGQQKPFQTESSIFGSLTRKSGGNIQAQRQRKMFQSKNKKFMSTTLKANYKAVKNNPFTKINTNYAVPSNNNASENGEQSKAQKQNNKMNNVNHIDIKYLRNLSKSNNIKEWYIIPDIEVLLEDFHFLTMFTAEDPTCKLMIPEVIIKKLESFTDSRATVAQQIVQWLTVNAVIETNNEQYVLTNVILYEKIIKFCIEAKVHHVVFITKEEHLRDAAKINGVYAYYLSELNLTNKSNNATENLFLQNIDHFDRFIISHSLQNSNNSSNYINDNNNNNMTKTLNLPNPKTYEQKGRNCNKNRPENIIIRCLKTGERTISYNQNFDENNQRHVNDSTNDFIGSRNRSININENTQTTNVANMRNEFETNNRMRVVRFECSETQNVHFNSWIKTNNIFNAGVDFNNCNDSTSHIHEDYEQFEKELKDFCTKHSHLQDYIIESRFDEWSCCFVQIIEQFLDDIFQGSSIEKYAPPHYFQQGLKCLRDVYSQNKYICHVIDTLLGLCGFRLVNGVVRTNIKTEQFLKILGAGILLIEGIDKVTQLSDLCKYYKEMLCNLTSTIQASESDDFTDSMSMCLEINVRIEDE